VRPDSAAGAEENPRVKAIPLLEKSIEIYPGQTGLDSAYASLAEIYRSEKKTDKEQQVLKQWAKYDDEAAEALMRLLELDTAAKDSKSALQHANTFLEINPLHPQVYRARGEAEEQLSEEKAAVQSYRTVLKLDPPDRPEIHFRLARLLKKDNSPAAHRHILLALEEAPRFRAAHKLLLELAEPAK
jgi:tetratricopeptide (TPR) repeat protein